MMIPFPPLRPNCKQANWSNIYVNLSNIQANWSDIQSKRSTTQVERSAVLLALTIISLNNHVQDHDKRLLRYSRGGLPYNKNRRVCRKLWKEPLRGTRILPYGRGFELFSPLLRGTNSKMKHRLLLCVSGPNQLKSARKICLLPELLVKIRWVLACSCSQHFCYCSNVRTLVKITVWELLYSKSEKPWENACAMSVFGNMDPRFADVLLKLMHVTILLEREEYQPDYLGRNVSFQ